MRSNFRPDMAGAARSAMRCIGQAWQRTRYAAKIDPEGGQTTPVDVVATPCRWTTSPAATRLATGFVWPSHDVSFSDSGYLN